MASFSHLGYFPNFLSYRDPESSELIVARNQAILNISEQNCENTPPPFGTIPRYYPDIWMPVTPATAMYWRVKKWKLNYNGTWTESEGGSVFEYEFSRDFFVGQWRYYEEEWRYNFISGERDILAVYDFTAGSQLSNEKDLICKIPQIEGSFPIAAGDEGEEQFYVVNTESLWGHEFRARGLGSTENPASGTNTDGVIQWNYGSNFYDAEQNFYNDFDQLVFYRINNGVLEFKPRIYFEASTLRWTGIYASNWTSLESQNLPMGSYGTFSYIINGQEFSAPIYAFNLQTSSAELNINVSLEATEYWQYQN